MSVADFFEHGWCNMTVFNVTGEYVKHVTPCTAKRLLKLMPHDGRVVLCNLGVLTSWIAPSACDFERLPKELTTAHGDERLDMVHLCM